MLQRHAALTLDALITFQKVVSLIFDSAHFADKVTGRMKLLVG